MNEVRHRQSIVGLNAIEAAHSSFWRVFKEETKEPLIVMLLIVGLLYFVWGQIDEAFTVLLIILVCIFIEIAIEWNAKNAILKLQSSQVESRITVIRESKLHQTAAADLVPGDLIELNSGDRVQADARLIECSFL